MSLGWRSLCKLPRYDVPITHCPYEKNQWLRQSVCDLVETGHCGDMETLGELYAYADHPNAYDFVEIASDVGLERSCIKAFVRDNVRNGERRELLEELGELGELGELHES